MEQDQYNNTAAAAAAAGSDNDYVDELLPGYRFCPTDSELIVYYLKQKIETGQHPLCRLYEVNLYDYNPDQLAEGHRACDGKWYFLTRRDRKYPRGNRPNRRTKNLGYWKTTQKDTTVYDDVTREAVGRKRSLAFHNQKDRKTPWLMHEYTLNDPNLPIGSGQNGSTLTEWVLCKIYKKETNNHRANNNRTSNQYSQQQQQQQVVINQEVAVINEDQQINLPEEEEEDEEHEPPHQRQRLTEISQPQQADEQQHFQIQEANANAHHHQPAAGANINNVGQPVAWFQGSTSSTIIPLEAPPHHHHHQVFATQVADQYSSRNSSSTADQFMSNATNNYNRFRFWEDAAGASTSISEPLAQPPALVTYPTTSTNMPLDAAAGDSTSIFQPLVNASQQPALITYPTSTNMPLDAPPDTLFDDEDSLMNYLDGLSCDDEDSLMNYLKNCLSSDDDHDSPDSFSLDDLLNSP